ncbi:hypothetical protein LCGC14_1036610 [marine sediment metagenome]|uniref:Uncharacterized protein n=1 Tax=marine sediment metagenome TaxID=412755 RepID=A0A0F9QB86_9ZZZZ
MKSEDIREEGNKFTEKGDFKLAIKSFRKVIDIDPKNFKVWADLGSVY